MSIFDKIVSYAVKRQYKQLQALDVNELISNAEVFANSLYVEYGADRKENFIVFFIDGASSIITKKHYGTGTINNISFYIREVARDALLCDATGIIMCHTHPSYDLEISKLDIQTTNKVKKGLALLDIQVYDHILVGRKEYVSFREKELL